MGDLTIMSTADVLCGSHACQHNFRLLFSQKERIFQISLLSFRSPDKHSLRLAAHLYLIDQL